MAKVFVPPKSVAKEAREGLEMRSQMTRKKKCATLVGLKRANTLMKRRPLSLQTIKRMYSFFQRHFKNRRNPPPRCGMVSWKLWGGDSGAYWVIKILEKEGIKHAHRKK